MFDVSYVAHLARMHLSDAEKQKISAQLKDILAYVAKLNELDVSKVDPTAHAAPLTPPPLADLATKVMPAVVSIASTGSGRSATAAASGTATSVQTRLTSARRSPASA